MRKIIMFNMLTIDGFFAGSDGNIDWHTVDDEFNDFAVEQTKSFGGIIFGKTTYQLFESFWPQAAKDPATSPEDREIAETIDNLDKIVYSKSLTDVTWNNTTLYHEINADEVNKLKEQKGNALVIFGSGTVVRAMTELGLIDEYRIMLSPTVLGEGKRLFGDKKFKLKLLNSRTFGNGNVLLTYVPTK